MRLTETKRLTKLEDNQLTENLWYKEKQRLTEDLDKYGIKYKECIFDDYSYELTTDSIRIYMYVHKEKDASYLWAECTDIEFMLDHNDELTVKGNGDDYSADYILHDILLYSIFSEV